MTKSEIKKMLECCASVEIPCDECPNYNECPNYDEDNINCKNNPYAQALDLITEQEKEIERLEIERVNLKYELLQQMLAFQALKAATKVANYIIEAVNKTKETMEVQKAVKQAQIDMLNEVKARRSETFVGKRIISAVDIDKIIEEVKDGYNEK